MGYRWPNARLDLLNKRVPQLDQENTPITGDTTARNGDVLTCANTTAITITLPASPDLNSRVTVIRTGVGAVTIDGNGELILGEETQDMPSVYDAADMIFTSEDWVLT